MTENCPVCARRFEKLEDFPIIYLRNIKRQEIPSDLVFPYRDFEIYVDQESRNVNEKVPKEVEEFFRKNREAKEFEYEGWIWEISKFGTNNNYYRSQKNQRSIIVKHLNNYLNVIEKLVGKEIPAAHFLPQFNRDSYFDFAYSIPETGYQIMFSEKEKRGEIRNTELIIMGEGPNLGSAGGPTLEDLSIIAEIEYEGRLLK